MLKKQMSKIRITKSIIFSPDSEEEIDVLYNIQKESLKDNRVRIWNKVDIKSLLQQKHIHAYILQNKGINISYIIFSNLSHECEIFSLGTIEKMRGKGYARELLEFFVEKNLSDNNKIAFLEVEENNQAAIDLYEKFSFRNVGIRNKYYSNNENALIMKRS